MYVMKYRSGKGARRQRTKEFPVDTLLEFRILVCAYFDRIFHVTGCVLIRTGENTFDVWYKGRTLATGWVEKVK